jgi:protein gp37
MPLNKSKGNMYPWITHTWNPVRGECPYQCSYCYVKRWGNRQNPLHLDEKELRSDLGRDNFIFVCSGCDLFHPDVPDEWIIRVLAATDQFPENRYLLHTKNPRRANDFSDWLNDTYTLCVTIESDFIPAGISNAPSPMERAEALSLFPGDRMVTIEPILNCDLQCFSEMIKSVAPVQVNIGADSGNNRLPEPSPEKIVALIEALRSFTRVDLKPNLTRLYKGAA